MPQLFDIDLLDDDDPFEIDHQAAHLFKHLHLGIDDIYDVWRSDPLFYPAKPPVHWLMVAQIAVACSSCPWHRRTPATKASAARSAATWPPNTSPPATGRTDEPQAEDDPR